MAEQGKYCTLGQQAQKMLAVGVGAASIALPPLGIAATVLHTASKASKDTGGINFMPELPDCKSPPQPISVGPKPANNSQRRMAASSKPATP